VSTSVTLRGNLTRDPELRFSKAGTPVATFTVVTSRRVKDQKTNEWSDADTSFWNCVAFGDLADHVAESAEKGTGVIVIGAAAQEEWTSKDGEKRRGVKVTAEDVAVSLRWRSAKVGKAAERPKDQQQDENPFAGDEPPF
jgi:single-strand DNA-binding protein